MFNGTVMHCDPTSVSPMNCADVDMSKEEDRIPELSFSFALCDDYDSDHRTYLFYFEYLAPTTVPLASLLSLLAEDDLRRAQCLQGC